MIVTTKPCPLCQQTSKLEVPTEGYNEWRRGEHVQHALPELSADDRELLITGCHPKCWDKMFAEEE